MADEKKKDGKDKDKGKDKAASGFGLDPIESIILVLLLLSLISTAVPMLIKYFTSGFSSSGGLSSQLGELTFYGFKLSSFFAFLRSNVFVFKAIGFSTAGVFAVLTFVWTKWTDRIWREEKAKVYSIPQPENLGNAGSVKDPMIEKWEKILKLSESENSSDWRLAIIEADIILDDLLDKLQLSGETIGDKLKSVEQSDFTTLDSAWEAHKARNAIAHEGQDFSLNQRETRRIISLYGSVFKEFNLI